MIIAKGDPGHLFQTWRPIMPRNSQEEGTKSLLCRKLPLFKMAPASAWEGAVHGCPIPATQNAPGFHFLLCECHVREMVGYGALLYFSSLHLCRISKLLWWTGWWRKLKLSTLFKTASSCPWEAKQKQKTWREEKDYISRNQGRIKNSADNWPIDTEFFRSHITF